MMVIGTNTFTAAGLFAVLAAMLLGLFSTYPAVKAGEWGKSFLKWYIFSFFFFPVALAATVRRETGESGNASEK